MYGSLLRCALLILGLCGLSAPALAQTCHMGPDPLVQAESTPFRAGVGAVFAGYRNGFGSGNYQGLNASFAYQHRWWTAGASVAGYRLTRDDSVRGGIGDAALDLRGTVYRDDARGLSFGVGLAAMLPTGNDKHGFGMGHVMLMPGVWFMLDHKWLMLLADVSFGRALGDEHADQAGMGHDHAHHAAGHVMPPAHGSIVQPMNRSELTHALTLGARLSPNLRLLGRVFGAVPVAMDGGEVREVVALGLQGTFGRWDVSAEAQVPVVGDPFVARGLLTSGVAW